MQDDRERAREQKRLEAEQLDDIRWLMSSRRGRRIMWRILSHCGTFARTLDTNALLMASNEGKRSVGSSLFGLVMQACPEQYVAMTEEMKPKKKGEEDGN